MIQDLLNDVQISKGGIYAAYRKTLKKGFYPEALPYISRYVWACRDFVQIAYAYRKYSRLENDALKPVCLDISDREYVVLRAMDKKHVGEQKELIEPVFSFFNDVAEKFSNTLQSQVFTQKPAEKARCEILKKCSSLQMLYKQLSVFLLKDRAEAFTPVSSAVSFPVAIQEGLCVDRLRAMGRAIEKMDTCYNDENLYQQAKENIHACAKAYFKDGELVIRSSGLYDMRDPRKDKLGSAFAGILNLTVLERVHHKSAAALRAARDVCCQKYARWIIGILKEQDFSEPQDRLICKTVAALADVFYKTNTNATYEQPQRNNMLDPEYAYLTVPSLTPAQKIAGDLGLIVSTYKNNSR